MYRVVVPILGVPLRLEAATLGSPSRRPRWLRPCFGGAPGRSRVVGTPGNLFVYRVVMVVSESTLKSLFVFVVGFQGYWGGSASGGNEGVESGKIVRDVLSEAVSRKLVRLRNAAGYVCSVAQAVGMKGLSPERSSEMCFMDIGSRFQEVSASRECGDEFGGYFQKEEARSSLGEASFR